MPNCIRAFKSKLDEAVLDHLEIAPASRHADTQISHLRHRHARIVGHNDNPGIRPEHLVERCDEFCFLGPIHLLSPSMRTSR